MAVKTTMSDLHMILMEQMQRLNESEPDELKAEIERSEAMAELGKSIVANASLMVKVARINGRGDVPKALTSGDVDG